MTHLTHDELQQLRYALEVERSTLQDTIAKRDNEARGIASRVTEAGDVAEQMIEQESALRLAAFDRSLLAEVEHALAKLEAGTYGISEDSGAPISMERLRVIPWARRTLEEEEK
jgi:DnaK suppressor protein